MQREKNASKNTHDAASVHSDYSEAKGAPGLTSPRAEEMAQAGSFAGGIFVRIRITTVLYFLACDWHEAFESCEVKLCSLGHDAIKKHPASSVYICNDANRVREKDRKRKNLANKTKTRAPCDILNPIHMLILERDTLSNCPHSSLYCNTSRSSIS